MKILSYRVFNYRSIDPDDVTVPMGRFTTLVGANNTGKTSAMLALTGGLYVLTSDQQSLSMMGSLLWNDDNRFQDPNEPDFNELPSGVSVRVVFDRDEIADILPVGTVWERPKFQVNIAKVAKNLETIGLVFTVDFAVLGGRSKANKGWADLLGPTSWLDKRQTKDEWSNAGGTLSDAEMDLAVEELMRQPQHWEWLKDFEVIYVEANRGGYPAQRSNSQWDYQYLVNYQAEQRPGELANLIEALELPERRSDQKRFLKYLAIVTPDIERVTNHTDSLGRHVYVSQGGHEQPLYRSGNGVANVMYLCARVLKAVRRRKVGGVIIVDEPESGLHPDLHRRLMQLASAIHDDFGIQWVMGTHSPYLLLESLTAEDRVLMTRLVEGHTRMTPIESSDQLASLYEAIGFYLPSMLSAQGVLFVEGPSEMEFLRHVLPKVGLDARASRVVIAPIGGNVIISHVAPETLARLHPHILVLLDSELKAPDAELDKYRKRYVDCATLNCWIDQGSRALENLYPPQALQRIFECANLPIIDPYGDLDCIHRALVIAGAPHPEITEDKVKFARSVGRRLTPEEAQELTIVRRIKEWWPVDGDENGRTK